MKLRFGLLSGMALVFILGATSCTKDYICQCSIAYSGQPQLPDTLVNEYKLTDTKKKAKELCEQGSSESKEEGITTVETCRLY